MKPPWFALLLATSAAGAAPAPPCYPSEQPLPEMTKVIWCKSSEGAKAFYQVTFAASPNHCRVIACKHQSVKAGERPQDASYDKVPLKDCSAATGRPGCFVR